MISRISEISPRLKWSLLVFVLSLLVRAVILLFVVHGQTRIKFDENGYFRMAAAQHSVLKDLLEFKSPEKKEIEVTYGTGTWPPFHPLVLALGFLVFGKSINAARITVVLLSALTTPLIFLTGERLFGRKAGIAASFIHILHPSFIAFSHFLWSETTFIFILFLGVYLALRSMEVESQGKNIAYALGLGIIMGLLVLTRAAALTFLVAIVSIVFFKKKSWKLRIAALLTAVAAFSVVLSPWEVYLYKRTQRFVAVSNFSYRNLYLGNNPWVREGMTYEQREPNPKKRGALAHYARERSISSEEAAKELALKEISTHFGKFILRSIKRGLLLWTFDFFPLRHAAHVVYPPMPGVLIIFILLIFILWHTVLILFSVFGFLIKSPKSGMKAFVLVLIAAGILPYILTFANTRFNLPQIALLIPVAAFGMTGLRTVKKSWIYPTAGIATVLCLIGVFYYTYSNSIYKIIRPSSHYSNPIRCLDNVFHAQSRFADMLILRKKDSADKKGVILSILNSEGYSFLRDEEKKRIHVKLQGSRRIIIYSSNPKKPLQLLLWSETKVRSVTIEPISKDYWGDYKRIPLDDVELTWRGGY